ncbi:hypothetical protein IQ247_10985 [Plectonema cf. radiosum LEGE 06105]|uniref:Uncharacterized protein n=1 Tax=Plectonema cf. radiosum LEGE 06105 TaxID=945769 RepID=A0A8J7FF84_9CYAN|nr:hypothetical protein [Plectonema radiosum]MBE9213191.1 hypothetical protein [Plectonema cf. radiosum LEGE 06105]
MDSIDKLLSELKAEYQKPANLPTQRTEEVEKVKLDSSPLSSSFSTSPSAKKDVIDNILSQVKQDFEQKQLLQEQQKQQQLEKERIGQEKLKVKELEGLKKQAQEWLNKLEPLSPEGLWFESFAKNYNSQLEAAIEYLHTH